YFTLYFIAPYIAAFYHEEVLIKIARILFLIVIINSLSIVARAKLIIIVDTKSQMIANTSGTLLGAFLALIMAKMGYGYWSLVVLTLTREFISSLMIWLFSKWVPKLIFCLSSAKKLFKFGSNLLIAGLIGTTINNLYIVFIGRYYNATQVGYLSQGTNITNSLSGVISTTLHGVTYPILTSLNDDKERMIDVYKKIIEYTMIVTLPVMVGFAGIANTFVELFLGEKWKSMIPVIVLLCFARAVTPISSINMNILNVIGRSDLFLKVDLSKMPIFILAVVVSVSHGVVAVAIAILITSIIAFIINAYYPGKMFGFGIAQQLKLSIKFIIAAFVMFVTVINIHSVNLLLELVLKILIGAISYFVMLYFLKVKLFIDFLHDVKNKNLFT
ncbi:MAG: lipopolysaccharide biosynthesis protein, partial [Ignavibacteria bacterium]|nr:lipopolysaccharide biosynthesis protein [Ignavibacteria bacterium]